MKNSILSLALIIVMSSCEKEKDIPPGTISVKINGSETSFSGNPKVEDIVVPGGYGISIKGYKGNAGSSSSLIIDLVSGSPISTGTYSGNTGERIAIIRYNVYLLFFWNEYTSISSSVTLTKLDSEHVTGKFSGTVRNTDGTTQTLTDGVFNVSY